MKYSTKILSSLFIALMMVSFILNAGCLSSKNSQLTIQNITTLDSLPNKKEWLTTFTTSFNTGNLDSITKFTNSNSGNPLYTHALFKELGPISYKLDYEGAHWFQGNITKAWVGFVLRQNDSTYYVSGIRRGIRPYTAPLPRPQKTENWAKYLNNYLTASEKRNHFSGAVLVSKNGKTIFEDAYGMADIEQQIPNKTDTPFNLASVTKVFTGVAIAQLAQQGKLLLNDPISKYIPEYPKNIADKVTIHHLLTHTSGIELDNHIPYTEELAEANSLDDILKIQIKFLPYLNNGNYDNFETSDRFDYTNEGIDLLGIIVERVSGIKWQEYLQINIFNKAEMTKTGLLAKDSYLPELAKGYSTRTEDLNGWLSGKRREVKLSDSSMQFVSKTARPAGSGYSTVGDLSKFVDALQNNVLVNDEYFKKLTSSQINMLPLGGIERSYGYTFEIAKSNNLKSFGHSGGAPGMNTVLTVYPEEGISVIVLANFDHSSSIHVAEHIRELILANIDSGKS